MVDEEEWDDSMGDSRENSRTMESSSVSGKESSSSSSPSSEEEPEEQVQVLGAAAGGGGFCVRSKEKSRSCVEIRERR